MRELCLVLIAACGAAPPIPPPPANLASTELSSFELGIHDPAWRLGGTGKIEHDAFTFSYCCRGAGSAKRALPEVAPGGRWELSIEHVNSECSSAVHVLLFTHGTTTPIASEVLDAEARTAGTAHVVFSAPALPVELRLYAEGGLHCCGTTTVGSIVLRRSR